MTVGRVNYVSWFFTVIGWDGLLPACIVLAPTVIRFLFPNDPGAMELTSLLLPIAGFFIRFVIGSRYIRSNHCVSVRVFQAWALCLGCFLLVWIDVRVFFSLALPKGAFFATKADCVSWAIVISVYLTSMAFAMYPGRVNSLDDSAWPDDAFDAQEM